MELTEGRKSGGYTGKNILANVPPGSITAAIEKKLEGRTSKANPELMAEIVLLKCQGYTMAAITRMEGMPSRETINAWSQVNPEFLSALDRAGEVAAPFYHENAMTVIDEVEVSPDIDHKLTANELRKAQLKQGQYNKMAEVANPNKFGPKPQVAIQINNPQSPLELSTYQ